MSALERIDLPRVPVNRRSKSFIEVERAMSEADAEHEALRCLRCDLEFTKKMPVEINIQQPEASVTAGIQND
jgi:NADPH-dependent glutamate synthase beta subunit-like oxidoreductase